MRGSSGLLALAGLVALAGLLPLATSISTTRVSTPQGDFVYTCQDPKATDPIVYYSGLFGFRNDSDAAWNDQTWAYRQFGPITNITMFKAFFYDGLWHDIGEFKGIMPQYGNASNDMELLIGAKKPHIPVSFVLEPGEYFTAVEVEWADVYRWMNLTTNKGRWMDWGWKRNDSDCAACLVAFANQTYASSKADRPGVYLAAIRGNEGKPLPKELGGYKKRYIHQLQFVWAQAECTRTSVAAAVLPAANAPAPPPSRAPGFPLAGWLGRRRLKHT